MKSLFVVVILAYLALALLLFLFQRSFLYFPQAAAKNILAEEIRFLNDQQKLTGWVLNKGQEKAIIYYGGNAEAVEQNIHFYLKHFPDQTTYLVPYRGYGKNSGKPTEEVLYSDALYLFDQVREKHQNINLIGRSLGTGIATYVAVNRDINKLVLVTPYDSIENIAKDQYPFLPISFLLTDKYLSIERASKIAAKTLVIIAENDETITRKRTDNLVLKFKAELLTQVVIRNAGHNDVMDFPEYLQAIQSFVKF
jgi:pimeloyl-ACP methyl ester carboxylesterase